MAKFVAFFNVEKAHHGRFEEWLNGPGDRLRRLDPLEGIGIHPAGPENTIRGVVPYLAVGEYPLDGPAARFDTDEVEAAFAVARLLGRHLNLRCGGGVAVEMAHLADGFWDCKRDCHLPGFTVPEPPNLVLVGLRDPSQPALGGVEVVSLGPEDSDNPKRPLYPLVVEYGGADEGGGCELPFFAIRSEEALEDWADEWFDSWMIRTAS